MRIKLKTFYFLVGLSLFYSYLDGADFFQSMRMSIDEVNELYQDPLPNWMKAYGALMSDSKTILDRISLFKQQYESNIYRKDKVDVGVPHIIHQIWIGEDSFPENFRFCVNSVKSMHPTWEYMFWNNETIKNVDLRYRDIIEDVTIPIGMRADILRYEVLNLFGGTYLDIDTFCCKPFDDLNNRFGFYSCITSSLYCTGNGGVGCTAGHPIIKMCLDNLNINNLKFADVLQRTGSIYLTEQTVKYLKLNTRQDNIIILPSSYFYPMSHLLRFDAIEGRLLIDDILKFKKPETLSIHVWATSWHTSYLDCSTKLYNLLKSNDLIFENSSKLDFINKQRCEDMATPAIVAVKNDMVEVLDTLGRFGADFVIKDKYGLTALDYAKKLNLKRCQNIIEAYTKTIK